MEWIETANCGGTKSANVSSPSGRVPGPGGPVGCAGAVAAAGLSRVWVAAGAAYPRVEGGAGCVAGAPEAAGSCLCLGWAMSSRLGPRAGWAAVVLLNSWPELAGGYGAVVRARSGCLGPGAGWAAAVLLSISWQSASRSVAAAAWYALASCCILVSCSAMACMAATWGSTG